MKTWLIVILVPSLLIGFLLAVIAEHQQPDPFPILADEETTIYLDVGQIKRIEYKNNMTVIGTEFNFFGFKGTHDLPIDDNVSISARNKVLYICFDSKPECSELSIYFHLL